MSISVYIYIYIFICLLFFKTAYTHIDKRYMNLTCSAHTYIIYIHIIMNLCYTTVIIIYLYIQMYIYIHSKDIGQLQYSYLDMLEYSI